MSDFLISQILALGTLICGIAAFQFKTRVVILRMWAVAAAFGSAHFWFLDAFEACALVGITATRFFTASFTTDKRIFYLFIGLALTGYAWTYDTPISMLTLIATLVGTWGSFQGTEKAVYYTMFVAQVLWFTYNIIIWSPVAVAMEVMLFSSNLLGLLRHRRARVTAL